MSVKEMKALIKQAGLSSHDCLEKSDLRRRAGEAAQKINHQAPAPQTSASGKEQMEDSESDSDSDSDSDWMICPLTMDEFEDPVVTPYGHHFERAILEAWVTNKSETCPLTRQPLTLADIAPAEPAFMERLRLLRLGRLQKGQKREAEGEAEGEGKQKEQSTQNPTSRVPNCHFGKRCTNKACTYAHPAGRPLLDNKCKSRSHVMPNCHFGERCTNKDCKYTHPHRKAHKASGNSASRQPNHRHTFARDERVEAKYRPDSYLYKPAQVVKAMGSDGYLLLFDGYTDASTIPTSRIRPLPRRRNDDRGRSARPGSSFGSRGGGSAGKAKSACSTSSSSSSYKKGHKQHKGYQPHHHQAHRFCQHCGQRATVNKASFCAKCGKPMK
jgi:hypothetical protein